MPEALSVSIPQSDTETGFEVEERKAVWEDGGREERNREDEELEEERGLLHYSTKESCREMVDGDSGRKDSCKRGVPRQAILCLTLRLYWVPLRRSEFRLSYAAAPSVDFRMFIIFDDIELGGFREWNTAPARLKPLAPCSVRGVSHCHYLLQMTQSHTMRAFSRKCILRDPEPNSYLK